MTFQASCAMLFSTGNFNPDQLCWKGQKITYTNVQGERQGSMYNETRVQHVLSMGTRTQDFNCWGATKFIAGGSPTLAWVEYDAMGEWIKENYHPIKRAEVKAGDIVALFTKEMRLIHTAYNAGNKQYVHKLGQNVARLESLNKVLNSYAKHGLDGFVFLRRNELCE